jgi:ATP-dependent Lhr-like helicase
VASLSENAVLSDLLHPKLLQATAMVRLLLRGWLEPVKVDRMHLSTLVHQSLSVLKETGGQSGLQLYRSLCQVGPFRQVSPEDFKLLVQGLHRHHLIQQDAEGILFLGLDGERITSSPGFYAAFETSVELTVRSGARELGRLPARAAPKVGQCLVLNGRRWTVDSIAWKSKTIWVSPAVRKKAPVFLGSGGETHDRVFQEMRDVLMGEDEPAWLDPKSREVLQSARESARAAGLMDSDLLDLDDAAQWFPWVGTRTMRTLELWAQHEGLPCTADDLSLTFAELSRKELERRLTCLADEEPDAIELAALMEDKRWERFDEYVDVTLLDKANSTYRLDVASASEAARRATHGPRQGPPR